MTDQATHLIRCPDCDYAEVLSHDRAKSKQHRHTCNDCDRGLAVQPLTSASDELLASYGLSADDESLYMAAKA